MKRSSRRRDGSGTTGIARAAATPAVSEERVGAQGDVFEVEAHRIADRVARGGVASGAAAWSAAHTLHREAPTIRRAPREGTPDVSPEPPPAAATPAVDTRASGKPTGPLLVEDGADVASGQMQKSEFLDQLRVEICSAVDEALSGTGRDSQGCPWIDHWIDYYRGRSAGDIETSLQRYAPEARGARGAAEYMRVVVARVHQSARTWARTGTVSGVPQDVPGSPMAGGEMLNAFGGMFFKARPGGARPSQAPAAVQEQLGEGSPLPAPVRTSMESAFGTSFGHVRMHADATGARLSDRLNARAFTVGPHVAFSAGEFRPGTLAGDTLIAHELAHVVQQHSSAEQRGGASSQGATERLEADADRSAVAYASHGGSAGRNHARHIAPRLRTGLTLSRCSKSTPASRSVAKGTDFRAGTALPDSATQAAVQRELHPAAATSSSPALAMWDAHSSSPGTAAEKTARKTDLKTKVTQAMLNRLNAEMPSIQAASTAPRVAVTKLEGPGNAAKKVVDTRFNEWIAVAALTPSQSTLRHGFAFRAAGASKNLFDANDRAERAAAGLPIDPDDLANWIAESAASAPMAAHSFSPTRGGEEQLFLQNEIVTPFVAAHRADLELFDLFGFALTNQGTGQIVAPTSLPSGLSSTPGVGGEPSPGERFLRWSTWETLVHEYIHTLEHPVFHSAGGNSNRIMSEGFCTLFSEEVLTDQIPKAPKNPAIRADVEGGSFPEPPAGTVPPFEAGDYAEYLAHAKAIRSKVGDNAVKAAFFQGHVEFLGLDPTGGSTAPVAPADRDLVSVPTGIATVADLASAANVSAAAIVAANPGLSASSAVSGRLHVPGAREHIVVEAGPHGSETKDQIAKQNGVTEGALELANPRATWASLSAGQRILIPHR